MRKKYVRMASRAARWSPRFGIVALIVLLVSAVLHRFSVITTFRLFELVNLSTICVILSLGFAFKSLYDLWQRGDSGGLKAFRGIVYSLITATPLLIFAGLWFALPPINDVSTDTETPPEFIVGSRPIDALPVSNDLSKQAVLQLAQWPQLSGRRYDGSPDRILKSVRNVLDARGWKVLANKGVDGEDDALYVETQARTFYLGFTSDIVIRLIDEGDTTFVDMRSASRYLTRDFGTNAAFITDFMDALDTEMLSTPVDQDKE